MDEQRCESSEWGRWRKKKMMKMVKNELIAKDQMMVAVCQVKLVKIEISGSRGGEPWALWAPSPLTRDKNRGGMMTKPIASRGEDGKHASVQLDFDRPGDRSAKKHCMTTNEGNLSPPHSSLPTRHLGVEIRPLNLKPKYYDLQKIAHFGLS